MLNSESKQPSTNRSAMKVVDEQANKGQKFIGTVKCIVTCDEVEI